MTLTRDQILGAALPAPQLVDVPEWGGQVFVRVLTGEELDSFYESLVDDKANFRAKLVAVSACDESGKRLFTIDDVAALGGRSGSALSRVARAAQRLNLMTGDTEGAEKNS